MMERHLLGPKFDLSRGGFINLDHRRLSEGQDIAGTIGVGVVDQRPFAGPGDKALSNVRGGDQVECLPSAHHRVMNPQAPIARILLPAHMNAGMRLLDQGVFRMGPDSIDFLFAVIGHK